MALKGLALSLLLGLAGGLIAYLLAWGLMTTHPESGMDPLRARMIGIWCSPLAFFGSLIYLSAKNDSRS